MNYVIAEAFDEAREFAEIQGWYESEWRYVGFDEPHKISDRSGITVWAPKFTELPEQISRMIQSRKSQFTVNYYVA